MVNYFKVIGDCNDERLTFNEERLTINGERGTSSGERGTINENDD